MNWPGSNRPGCIIGAADSVRVRGSGIRGSGIRGSGIRGVELEGVELEGVELEGVELEGVELEEVVGEGKGEVIILTKCSLCY